MAAPDLDHLSSQDVMKLSDEELKHVTSKVIAQTQQIRKENQILFYKPASPKAEQTHQPKPQPLSFSP